jgi:hypothetical protein
MDLKYLNRYLVSRQQLIFHWNGESLDVECLLGSVTACWFST